MDPIFNTFYDLLLHLFPGYTLEFNYSYKKPDRGVYEFDIFIPVLSLAVEYNGEYHYNFIPVYLSCSILTYRIDFLNLKLYRNEINPNDLFVINMELH